MVLLFQDDSEGCSWQTPSVLPMHRDRTATLLENGGNKFKAFTFPKVTNGRWIVMDANDLDRDGDIDLALGSFVGFKPEGDTTGLYRRWVSDSPSIVVLENTILP